MLTIPIKTYNVVNKAKCLKCEANTPGTHMRVRKAGEKRTRQVLGGGRWQGRAVRR